MCLSSNQGQLTGRAFLKKSLTLNQVELAQQTGRRSILQAELLGKNRNGQRYKKERIIFTITCQNQVPLHARIHDDAERIKTKKPCIVSGR